MLLQTSAMTIVAATIAFNVIGKSNILQYVLDCLCTQFVLFTPKTAAVTCCSVSQSINQNTSSEASYLKNEEHERRNQ